MVRRKRATGGGGQVRSCLFRRLRGQKLRIDVPPSAAREGDAGSRGVCSSVQRQLELAAK